MNQSLTITIEEQSGERRIVLSGELDADNCHELRVATAGISGDDVTMDLSGLGFVDSSGIGQIIKLKEQIDASHGSFRVSGTSPSVRKVLEITGLLEYLGAQ